MTPKIPSDGILVLKARLAVRAELQKKGALNQPIARFDAKTGRLYMEYANGRQDEITYVKKRDRSKTGSCSGQ